MAAARLCKPGKVAGRGTFAVAAVDSKEEAANSINVRQRNSWNAHWLFCKVFTVEEMAPGRYVDLCLWQP